jgi:hypothetical protein
VATWSVVDGEELLDMAERRALISRRTAMNIGMTKEGNFLTIKEFDNKLWRLCDSRRFFVLLSITIRR